MKTLICNEDFEKKLIKSAQLIYDFVISTYGPKGKNVLISENGKTFLTKDGVTVAKAVTGSDNTENAILNVIKQCAERTVQDAGDGPQPLYSKVLTPTGFVKMEDLKVGDKICGTNNTIQEVLGIYPKGLKRIYKLKFSNDRTVECCLDHLWNVTTNYGKNKTITVDSMLSSGYKQLQLDGSIKYRYYVPNTSVDFYNQNLELDPYLVGLLLGDGSLTESGSIELSLSLHQEYVLNKLVLPPNIKYTVFKDEIKHYLRIKFSRIDKTGPTMHDYVKSIGLLNKTSKDKFIPKKYLYSSFTNRMSLLEGLIESDGYVNNRGRVEYSTISSQLCSDYSELMRGLGKQINIQYKKRKGDSYSNTSIYVITELKGDKYGIKLKEIEETNKYTEMMCIKVSNPDNLYITDDYIVTHNTTTAILLTYNFIFELLSLKKIWGNKIPNMELYDAYLKQIRLLCQQLEIDAVEISNKKMLLDVANIASNNDKLISELITDLIDAVGVNGNVSIKESKNQETYIKILEGMRFNSSLLSKSFLPDNQEKLILNDCVVVISNSKIQFSQDIFEILSEAAINKKSLLFICPDMDEKALITIAMNVEKKALQACVLTPAYLGQEKLESFEDIATICGTVVNSTPLLNRNKIQDWGYVKSVEITRNSCILLDGAASPEHIDSVVLNLKNRLKETEDEFISNRLISRINRLTSTIGILYIGGRTPAEVIERKHRAEDALESCNSALRKGVIPGGGVGLRLASLNLKCDETNIVEKFIISSIRDMCSVQIKTLYNPWQWSNAYKFENTKPDDPWSEADKLYVLDLRIMELVDWKEHGLVESVWTVQSALQNAFSCAWLLVNTFGSIVND